MAPVTVPRVALEEDPRLTEIRLAQALTLANLRLGCSRNWYLEDVVAAFAAAGAE